MQAGAGSTRRACLRGVLAAPALIALPGLLLGTGAVHAGGQLEEPLIDSVRSALSAAVRNAAPPVPEFPHLQAQTHYQTWLQSIRGRLQGRRPEVKDWQDFLQTVWYESKRAGLDVSLVLGLMEVESGFRKFAISSAGAMGVMQVMPFWPRLLARVEDVSLFQWQTNMRFGCVILRHYLKLENGNLTMALGRYNGSRGQSAYPAAVLAAQQRWQP